MDISCTPEAAKIFDHGLALLHNFWYGRALDAFRQAAKADPDCAMALWGAAMTFNHPFWDAPKASDVQAALDDIVKAKGSKTVSERERLLIDAAYELYRDADSREKGARDGAYRSAMAAAYARYPDDETKLFYALSIMGAIKEGAKGFDQQAEAARLLEDVFRTNPQHPGALHYLVHVYDDPAHAENGLDAARRYAKTAAAVPHALHMPSHIFTRLGLWEDSVATNERAWKTSQADVARAGEKSALRDFHSLNYLQYAYLQLGEFRKARAALETIAAEYDGLADRKTAQDTPELQSRHVRGRTIYALPDRIAYGYFDMLTRLVFESRDWKAAAAVPLVAPSRDFRAAKLHLDAISAAMRGDATASALAAKQLSDLAVEPGQHPFVQQIVSMQAREAEAFSAFAAGRNDEAIAKMKDAVAIEDSIDSLSQPPYPSIPANELLGDLLMEMKKPDEARRHYLETLKRTPGRPMAIFGAAKASAHLQDRDEAVKRFREFLALWRRADPDRPELAAAKAYLAK
jgi:tetratricopeptide (TPR) repeat protein